MSTSNEHRCSGPSGPETRPATRREFLRRAGGGFGMLALTSLLGRDGLLTASAIADSRPTSNNPLAPKQPHFAARARSVIFLFMSGGPSHVDLFDPKPDLTRF